MAVGYNPRVVTDGLVLTLDAGNTKSYKKYSSGWSGSYGSAINSFDGSTSTFTGYVGGNFSATYTFQETLRTSSTVRINSTLGASVSQVGSNTNIVLVNGIDVTQKLKDAGAYAPASQWIDVTTEVGGVFKTIQINGTSGVANPGISAIEIGGQILNEFSWTDLSGNSNNGTLTNGPTFNSANGGAITFDGANDRGTFSSPITSTSNQTYEVWTNAIASSSATDGYAYILHNNSADASTGNSYLTIGIKPTQQYYAALNGRYAVIDSGVTASNSNIVQIVLTWDGANQKMYVNSVLKDSEALTGTPQNFSSTTSFGDYASYTFRMIQGNIYSIKIYNKALSAAEIQQNFNALRGRFGI